jgi:hypothetical protein
MPVGIVAVLVLCKVKIPALEIDALPRGELAPQERSFAHFFPHGGRPLPGRIMS